ncbi:MAG: hypothetical protein GY822_12135 [Deltaproteobacteria bacterium]|nr:hypothetical protein [Deltaproteobacteria bacterium]
MGKTKRPAEENDAGATFQDAGSGVPTTSDDGGIDTGDAGAPSLASDAGGAPDIDDDGCGCEHVKAKTPAPLGHFSFLHSSLSADAEELAKNL